MSFRFVDDRGPAGFSWLVEEPMTRTSHALAAGGRVWLVDPVDWPPAIERALGLGEPTGVIQLLDRHNRDCADLADELGVPHLRVPSALPDSPFAVLPVVSKPRWSEVALWWEEERTLVVAEALGSNPFFTVDGDRLGVHGLLKPFPPRRRFAGLTPAHVLVGVVHQHLVEERLHRVGQPAGLGGEVGERRGVAGRHRPDQPEQRRLLRQHQPGLVVDRLGPLGHDAPDPLHRRLLRCVHEFAGLRKRLVRFGYAQLLRQHQDRDVAQDGAQVRQAAQQVAEATGQSFSAVVSSALEAWVRGRLTDVWLSHYQAEHGAFTEAELIALAEEAGVPYLPPSRPGDPGRARPA